MRRRGIAVSRLNLGRLGALFAHDPAQAGYLAGLVIVGLVLIGLWGLYGDLLFSNLLVVAVIELLIAAYVVAIASLVVKLVRSQDRWQVDSALMFRQLLSEGRNSAGDAQVGSPFYARQLRLRVEEETKRAREYGTSFSLLVMRLELPGQSPSHAVFAQANAEVAELAMSHREMLISPTALGMFDYAFCLRTSDRAAAQAMAGFLTQALKRYRCFFGVAAFPEDGADPDQLIRRAVERCGVLRDDAA